MLGKDELNRLRDSPIEGVAARLGLQVVRHRCLSLLVEEYPEAKLVGHRDLNGGKKACPCFDVKKEYKYIKDGLSPRPLPQGDLLRGSCQGGSQLVAVDEMGLLDLWKGISPANYTSSLRARAFRQQITLPRFDGEFFASRLGLLVLWKGSLQKKWTSSF